MSVRVAEVDRVCEIVVDDRIGGHQPALVILQLVVVETSDERHESFGVDPECDAMESGSRPRLLRLALEKRQLGVASRRCNHQWSGRICRPLLQAWNDVQTQN